MPVPVLQDNRRIARRTGGKVTYNFDQRLDDLDIDDQDEPLNLQSGTLFLGMYRDEGDGLDTFYGKDDMDMVEHLHQSAAGRLWDVWNEMTPAIMDSVRKVVFRDPVVPLTASIAAEQAFVPVVSALAHVEAIRLEDVDVCMISLLYPYAAASLEGLFQGWRLSSISLQNVAIPISFFNKLQNLRVIEFRNVQIDADEQQIVLVPSYVSSLVYHNSTEAVQHLVGDQFTTAITFGRLSTLGIDWGSAVGLALGWGLLKYSAPTIQSVILKCEADQEPEGDQVFPNDFSWAAIPNLRVLEIGDTYDVRTLAPCFRTLTVLQTIPEDNDIRQLRLALQNVPFWDTTRNVPQEQIWRHSDMEHTLRFTFNFIDEILSRGKFSRLEEVSFHISFDTNVALEDVGQFHAGLVAFNARIELAENVYNLTQRLQAILVDGNKRVDVSETLLSVYFPMLSQSHRRVTVDVAEVEDGYPDWHWDHPRFS